MIKCVVLDDEPLAARLIAGYVERTPGLELAAACTDAAQAMRAIKESDAQLVFLDIEMPQLSGIEIARLLPEGCRVVFITAYDRYAVEGFRVRAVDYLLKPVAYEEFLQSVDRAREVLEPAQQAADPAAQALMVKSGYETVRLPFASIVAVESQKNRVLFHMADGTSVSALMPIKAVEQALPDEFLRVHRGFIVNTRLISSARRGSVRAGGLTIPVSDTYRAALDAALAPK